MSSPRGERAARSLETHDGGETEDEDEEEDDAEGDTDATEAADAASITPAPSSFILRLGRTVRERVKVASLLLALP
jgi:hypothetical protein